MCSYYRQVPATRRDATRDVRRAQLAVIDEPPVESLLGCTESSTEWHGVQQRWRGRLPATQGQAVDTLRSTGARSSSKHQAAAPASISNRHSHGAASRQAAAGCGLRPSRECTLRGRRYVDLFAAAASGETAQGITSAMSLGRSISCCFLFESAIIAFNLHDYGAGPPGGHTRSKPKRRRAPAGPLLLASRPRDEERSRAMAEQPTAMAQPAPHPSHFYPKSRYTQGKNIEIPLTGRTA